MLHGAQSNHRLALKLVFGFSNQQAENDLKAIRYFQPRAEVGYIVASPHARGTMGRRGFQRRTWGAEPGITHLRVADWARKPALTPYSFLSDLYNGNRVGIQFDSKVLRVIQ